MSSISPIETKCFAARIEALGCDYVDAPVSGGEVGAKAASLTIMVGAKPAVFERVKPLFELMGKNITLVGGIGDGQTCKVCNQIIVALNIEAVSEALVFAAKAGAARLLIHLGQGAAGLARTKTHAVIARQIGRGLGRGHNVIGGQGLAGVGQADLADFGTRRRHSFLWQKWCIEAMKEGIGDAFTGTSNVFLAMENDLESIGTNAHELPMVYAALCDDDSCLRQSPYKVLEMWKDFYDGNLLICLPDTFGTSAFLAKAPDWVADWTGFRPDSKPIVEAGEEIIAWYKERGRDPTQKIVIFSDGLDIESIEAAHARFKGRIRLGYGWGTNLTNDFRGCATRLEPQLDPISLVCKITGVNDRPAVKLSDNLAKATGPEDAIERYVRVFGEQGRAKQMIDV
jgi:hypothetical protein